MTFECPKSFGHGRYVTVRPLGEGGQSRVVLAMDRIDEVERVLKWRRERGATPSPELILQLGLEHPGLSAVLDRFFEPALGVQVLVEPWLDGVDLARAAESLDVAALDDVVDDLVLALSFLHARGLRHGDVKPANVLVMWRDRRRAAVLIDFGLAAAAFDPELPGATPGFLAPEVAAGGRVGPGIDWFALGRTIDLLGARAISGRVAELRDVLLVDDPDERRRGVRHWQSIHPAPAPRPSRLPFVGREAQLVAIDRRIGSAGAVPTRIRVDGPEGSGRTRLLESAARRWREAGLGVVFAGSDRSPQRLVESVAVALGTELDVIRVRLAAEVSPTVDRVVAEFVRLLSGRGVVVALGAEAAGGEAGMLMSRVIDLLERTTGDADHERFVVVEAASAGGVDDVHLSPLTTADLKAALLNVLPIDGASDDAALARAAEHLLELTGGHAARVESLILGAIDAGEIAHDAGRLVFDARALADRAHELARADAERRPSSRDARRLYDLLAANLRALDRATLLAMGGFDEPRLARAETELVALGLLRRRAGHRVPMILLAPDPAAGVVSTMWSLTRPARSRDDWLLRRDAVADRLLEWSSHGHGEAAARHLSRVLAGLEDPVVRAEGGILLARLWLAADRGDDAERAMATIDDSSPPHAQRDAALLRARRDLARNRPRDAMVGLEPWLAGSLAGAEQSELLTEAAHAALLLGEVDRAQVLAVDAARQAPDRTVRARALTMAAVAFDRSGAAQKAEAAFAEALAVWRELGDDKRRAATEANLALLEHRSGRSVAAAKRLESAALELERVGEAHQAASAATNLGVVLGALGRFGAAAAAHDRAARTFHRIGDEPRRFAAMASRGVARFGQGLPVPARRDLAEAELRLRSLPDLRPWRIAATYLVRVDRLLGRARAAARLEKRLGVVEASGANCLAEPSADSAADVAARLRDRSPDRRGGALVDAVVVRVRQARFAAAARLLHRLLALARSLEREMSEMQRTVYRADVVTPALRALERRLERLLPDHAVSGGDSTIAGVLERVAAATSDDDIFAAVADGLFAATRAVRVYLLALDVNGGFTVTAAFDRRQGPIEPSAAAREVSRRIVEDAIAEDRPLAVADAGADERLAFQQSVRRLGITSVACVPLRGAAGTNEMLYLDCPLAAGAFDRDAMRMIGVFAALLVFASRGAAATDDVKSKERSLRRRITEQRIEIATRSRELSRARERQGHGVVIGRSAALATMNELVRKLASTNLSVLIRGETGVGKELVAEALHEGSDRRQRPFVAINCAALPPALAESEFFGHKKGAFTGAVKDEPGLFRMAHQGTLFLDEIGELPAALQAKLLRAIETGRARAVGSSAEYRVDVRVLAATHRDLEDESLFRRDLYYRVAQATVEVPALRERLEDVSLLARHFLKLAGKDGITFEREAMEALEAHTWPGNVRELRNVVERAALLCADGAVVRLTDLPREIWDQRGTPPKTLADVEREAIARALAYAGGERKAAARLLGISRSTLYEKLGRLGPDFA